MKRSVASEFIDDVRQLASGGVPHGMTLEQALSGLLERFHLSPLEPCGGEAHSNAYIDNCSRCSPRWGFVGPKEPVT